MYKVCMKRYFYYLRHILGVLGILFLAFLIGGSIFFSGAGNALTTMTEDIKATTGQADLSVTRVVDAVKNSISDSFSENTVAENAELLTADGATEAVSQSFEDALSETVTNYGNYMANIGGIIATAVGAIFLYTVIFFLIQIISWFVGKKYVIFVEKHSMKKDGGKSKSLKEWFVKHGLILLIVIILFAGFVINTYVGIVFLVLFPISYCICSLISSNLAYDKSVRLPMQKLLNLKIVFSLLGANLTQILCTVIFILILASIANWVIGLYLGIALFIIASATVSINADAIVLALINKRTSRTPSKVSADKSKELTVTSVEEQ